MKRLLGLFHYAGKKLRNLEKMNLKHWSWKSSSCRSSHPEVFLGKSVLRICCKFTGEHPYRNVISIKLQRSFIEITLRHGCSPVHLQHILRKPFPKTTSGWMLLLLYLLIKSVSVFLFTFSLFFPEVYLEPCQTPKMEPFVKIVYFRKMLHLR